MDTNKKKICFSRQIRASNQSERRDKSEETFKATVNNMFSWCALDIACTVFLFVRKELFHKFIRFISSARFRWRRLRPTCSHRQSRGKHTARMRRSCVMCSSGNTLCWGRTGVIFHSAAYVNLKLTCATREPVTFRAKKTNLLKDGVTPHHISVPVPL